MDVPEQESRSRSRSQEPAILSTRHIPEDSEEGQPRVDASQPHAIQEQPSKLPTPASSLVARLSQKRLNNSCLTAQLQNCLPIAIGPTINVNHFKCQNLNEILSVSKNFRV